MRTGNIGAFKLTNVASAYYKGDEKNPQLQRVYGTAFKTKKELDDYFAMIEEAKKRDHRKLGRELELFVFDDDVGPGLPMFLPRERNRVRRRLSARPHAAHRARKLVPKEWSSSLLR
jgi:threonyl-tRNA synthetase